MLNPLQRRRQNISILPAYQTETAPKSASRRKCPVACKCCLRPPLTASVGRSELLLSVAPFMSNYLGIAIAARMPRMMITITSSISVKPPLFFNINLFSPFFLPYKIPPSKVALRNYKASSVPENTNLKSSCYIIRCLAFG